jgi:hypothetical protein
MAFATRPLLAGVLLLLCLNTSSQEVSEQRFVADIELQTAEEFRETLLRAEQLLVEGVAPQGDEAAVTFVLHGPVIRDLLRNNYLANKDMVDLAASLSALGVVSIKACRTWMGGQKVDENQLQPFIETVSYGPGEVRRLVEEESYIYF